MSRNLAQGNGWSFNMAYYVSDNYKKLSLLGAVLVFSGVLVFLGVGIYALLVWWGVVSLLEIVNFVAAMVFFFITIPMAPIYIGIHGDWEPAVLIVLGVILGLVLLSFGLRLCVAMEKIRIGNFEKSG